VRALLLSTNEAPVRHVYPSRKQVHCNTLPRTPPENRRLRRDQDRRWATPLCAVRRSVGSRLRTTTKALADLAIFQGLLSWRGQDLNLRPSGYERTDARGNWSALIGISPDHPANRDRRTALSFALVRSRWCWSCCTTVVLESARAAAPRSSALVGASRADTVLTAAGQAASSRPRSSYRSSASGTAHSYQSCHSPDSRRRWRRRVTTCDRRHPLSGFRSSPLRSCTH
jgi:hypothetical protein